MKTLALALFLAAPSLAHAATCPLINGVYERVLVQTPDHSETNTITVVSKRDGDKTFFQFPGGPLLEANGQATRISANGQSGTIKLSCDSEKSVVMEMKVDNGSQGMIRLTLLSDTQIDVVAVGDESEGMSGTYTKKQ